MLSELTILCAHSPRKFVRTTVLAPLWEVDDEDSLQLIYITSLLMLYDSLQGAPTTRKYVRTTVFASLWEADDQLVGNVLSTSTSFLCAQPYSQAGTSVKYNY